MRSGRKKVLSSPGWTPVPNHLLDTMADRHPVQFKILLFLARRLYGYESPRDDFSVRFISDKTGLPRSTVHRHLAIMINEGTITVCGRGKKGARRLRISDRRPISLDGFRPADRSTGETTIPERGQIASRMVGQNKDNPVHKNVRVDLSSRSDEKSGLLLILEKSLSAVSYSKIESSMESVSNGQIRLSRKLPESLRFMLEQSTGMVVTTIPEAS